MEKRSVVYIISFGEESEGNQSGSMRRMVIEGEMPKGVGEEHKYNTTNKWGNGAH